MKVNMRKKSGITLIALIVTVIVLLIISGVTLSTLTGDDGILSKTNEAQEVTDTAKLDEQVNLAVLSAISIGNGKMKEENLTKYLNKKIGKGKYVLEKISSGWKITITSVSPQRVYYVSNDGELSSTEPSVDDGDNSGGNTSGNNTSGGNTTGGGSSGGDTSLPSSPVGVAAGKPIKNPSSYGDKAQATADGANKYFALPKGATYKTGTVDTGVVIDIDGSEFVWVPVADVVFENSKGGKLPRESTSGTTSGKTYTPMAIKSSDGVNYCGIFYDFSGKNAYLRYYAEDRYYFQGNSTKYQTIEPFFPSYNGINLSYYKQQNGGDNGVSITSLQAEYNKMIEQVIKYEGFYVGRYEVGIQYDSHNTGKIVSKVQSGNVDNMNSELSGISNWYECYTRLKEFTSSEDSVQSSMIYESQYDAMLNWMAKNNNEVGTANSNKTNTSKKSGTNVHDIINNVFDLYGCHKEWTQSGEEQMGRGLVGGYSDGVNSYYFPSRTWHGNSSNYNMKDSSYSSRLALYIK